MLSCRISNTVTDGVLSSSVLCFLVGSVTQLLMVYYQVVFCVFL